MADNNDLVLERVRKTPRPTLFAMDGKIFTPEDQLREIEEGTPIGRTFRKAEELMLQRTLEKKKKVGLMYGTASD